MLDALDAELAELLKYDPPYEWRGGNAELINSTDHEVIAEGGAECLGGEVEIFDPVLDRSFGIEYLYQNKIPPNVLTLHGTEKANTPFRKGYAALYKVTLLNGYSFTATAKHKVLTTRGWCFVGYLLSSDVVLSCGRIPQDSNSAFYLPTSPRDVHRYAQITQGFRGRYFAYSRQCGGQPQREEDSARFSSPLLNDVLLRNYDGLHEDVRAFLSEHIHLHQLSYRPSIARSFLQNLLLQKAGEGCDSAQCNTLYHPRESVELSPYTTKTYPQNTFDELEYHAEHTSSHVLPFDNSPLSDYTVFGSPLSSIEYVRDDYYYDLTVSNAGHYLANGIWHHNTGKSYAACYKSHMLCREYPKAQGALIRKVSASIPGTIFLTMKRIIGDFPVTFFGGVNNPERIIYPNGSQIWLGGMDNPAKALSGERDFIQVCQAEELTINDWEIMTTRVTGRGAVMPFTSMFGDCNPSGPKHHLRERMRAGHLKMHHTVLQDNPTLFDKWGNPTEQGNLSIARLSALTGIRRKRLFEGLWASPEGLIYDNFGDSDVIPRFPIPDSWTRYVGLDFGLVNLAAVFFANRPGTKEFYLYRTYHSGGFSVASHVEQIMRGLKQIPFCVGGSKSEGNWRKEFRTSGLPVKEPDIKMVEVGIDRVYDAHAKHEIKVFDDCLEYLDQKRSYARELDKEGIPTENIADKATFHLLDAERYIISFIKRKGFRAQGANVDLYAPTKQANAGIIPARSNDEVDQLLKDYEDGR